MFTKGDGDGLYWISMGKEPGGIDYYNKEAWDDGTADTALVVGAETYLPEDGSKVCTRLFTHYPDGTWQYNDYTFVSLDANGGTGGGTVTLEVPAVMTSPASSGGLFHPGRPSSGTRG